MSNGNVAGFLGGISSGLERRNQRRFQQKQEEERRKYREEQQAQARKYYADQETKRKAEQRKYTEGLKVQATELKEQSRIKAVTPVAESAAQYYAPMVQQGLMTEQDVQLQIQHIMTQSGGDSAYDTMIAAGKRFEPPKPKAPAKPSADEKFNAVMQAYFAGQGEQLSPSQWNIFRKAMPAGMKNIPLTPPEGVTSVGTLRNYMKQEKKQAEMTQQFEEAKIGYQAALTEFTPTDTDRPGSFDEWMSQGAQIKKYSKAYAAWKKQQVGAQKQRFSQPTTDIPGVPSGLSVPPATAIPQEQPQGAPAAQQDTSAIDAAIQEALKQTQRNQQILDSLLQGR